MKLRFVVSILLATASSLSIVAQTRSLGPVEANRATQASLRYMIEHATDYGLENPEAELVQRQAFSDDLGQSHVRFDQYYRGVKVFEGEAIGHVLLNGKVSEVTSALYGNLRLSTTPKISAATATSVAQRVIGFRGGIHSDAELVILPKGARSAATRLTWEVTTEVADVDGESEWHHFVDAQNGKILLAFDAIDHASESGTANTMYSGQQPIIVDHTGARFSLIDATRGGSSVLDAHNGTSTSAGTVITSTTSTVGDGVVDSANRATAGADALLATEKAWDYFKTVHGRNGLFNDGTKVTVFVHWSTNLNNASFSSSCRCTKFGDGSGSPGRSGGHLPAVAIDIVAHEMTHGVVRTSANLTGSGESAQLNESIADIFGEMIEEFANVPGQTADFLHGTRLIPTNFTTDGKWRNLTPPATERDMTHPSNISGTPNCWTANISPTFSAHSGNGPNNHMYFLLAHGGTSACNGSTVAGVGNQAAAKIMYRALTVYMTSSTNYRSERTAMRTAAADLFGAGSTQQKAVDNAFAGINVQ